MADFLLRQLDDEFWDKIRKETQQRDIHLKYLIPELLDLWLKNKIKIDEKKLRMMHYRVKSEGYARRKKPGKKKIQENTENN